MQITIAPSVLKQVPSLFVKTRLLKNIHVIDTSKIDAKRQEILNAWAGKPKEILVSLPKICAYRNLQEKLLQNSLSAVENLLTRYILQGKFPSINPIVDSANIASINNLIPIGAFNADAIKDEIELTLSEQGDEFMPLGKKNLEKLKQGTPILRDAKKIFSAVGARDSQETMITAETKNILLVSWGTNDIPEAHVEKALLECEYILSLRP